ncbi:hypothetical protein [Membranihabitans maritimus]|uniref:hypothetical protein n=1 Tax=Membranihabitans maritimus TaxID=2904244 RepID=UPI001F42B5B2|nr:hypothetical protein [Membranihabitans maritimus]
MYKLLSKYGLALAFVIGLVFTLIFLIPAMNGLPAGFGEMVMEEQTKTNAFNTGLKATIVLFIATVIITILASLLSVIKDPRAAIKGIIGIAILLILVFILYSTSLAEQGGRVAAAATEFGVNDNMSKWISAFIKGAFVLSGAAIVIVILGELRNLFK